MQGGDSRRPQAYGCGRQEVMRPTLSPDADRPVAHADVGKAYAGSDPVSAQIRSPRTPNPQVSEPWTLQTAERVTSQDEDVRPRSQQH